MKMKLAFALSGGTAAGVVTSALTLSETKPWIVGLLIAVSLFCLGEVIRPDVASPELSPADTRQPGPSRESR